MRPITISPLSKHVQDPVNPHSNLATTNKANKFGEQTKMRLIAFAVVVEVVVAVMYSDLFLWS